MNFYGLVGGGYAGWALGGPIGAVVGAYAGSKLFSWLGSKGFNPKGIQIGEGKGSFRISDK